MKHHIALQLLFDRLHHDIEDMRDVIEMLERHLKTEVNRLTSRFNKELKGLSEEEKQFTVGWYDDDFVRLDRVFPNIQRRSLFITLMCILESDMLLACEMCRRSYELPKRFKKKGNTRVIIQAFSYLEDNLTIRMRNLKSHWELVQNLWSIRNAIVHGDGIPKPRDLQAISNFCAPIPTLELDHHNRIVFHKGSVEMAIHSIHLFFSRLCDEIKRNKLTKSPTIMGT